MQNAEKIDFVPNPTLPEADGKVRGASLQPCNGVAAVGITAKGSVNSNCFFKIHDLLHFYKVLQIIHV